MIPRIKYKIKKNPEGNWYIVREERGLSPQILSGMYHEHEKYLAEKRVKELKRGIRRA